MTDHPKEALFFAIEGPDGVGKTEQVKLLAERLDGADRLVLRTREPSDLPAGELIRRALTGKVAFGPDAMRLLFAADRADHLAQVVVPALTRGTHVVCDRYDLSNLVYGASEVQGPFMQCAICNWVGEPGEHDDPACPSYGRHVYLSTGALERAALVQRLSEGMRRPDLTIVLHAPPEVCAARRKFRGAAAETYDDPRTQARVCAAYAAAHELLDGDHVVLVDASGDPGVVQELVWAAVRDAWEE